MFRNRIAPVTAILAAAALAACSPSRMVADMAGSALAGGGGVYASEEDPELLLAALPFGLKTMEGLIETSPRNPELRLAAARGFVAYAFLVSELETEAAAGGSAARRALDSRVARLFRRGRDQALAGLEIRHGGIRDALDADPDTALARTTAEDAELVYWAAAGWAGAISADKRDLSMVATLPVATALAARAVELDESFDGGAAHELMMQLAAGAPGGNSEAVETHYRRAVEIAAGTSAGVHVGYAEAVAVPRQDRAAFRAALDAALAVDADAAPERRLTNVLAQRRARRLRAEAARLFIAPEGGTS